VSSTYEVRLTQGHVLRHAPAQSPQGRDAAVIDIAQDLLLRHLSECGVLTLVAFKGGTALRKVYAGAAGRFSTDLDFSVASLDDDPAAVIQLLVGQIDDTRLGPFTYSIDERRGRYTILYQSDLGPDPTGPLQSKIDVGPPPWLAPGVRGWTCPSTAATADRSSSYPWSTWPRTWPRRSPASTGAAPPATPTTWRGWPARPASIWTGP
jgi:hypothetical protein